MNPHGRKFTLVDAHVHLHRCFETGAFIEGAYANFERTAEQFDRKPSFAGMLCLTEGVHEDGFDRLSKHLMQPISASPPWRLQQTEEPASLVVTDEKERTLIVVAGRQIPTRERLEVLAIGTRQSFEADRPIEETICAVASVGALPIIPWGAGKWVGARGQRVHRLIQHAQLPTFFLGDSANRPMFWPTPRLLRLAVATGIRNLPGSDPLPFPTECRRAGRCGFMLQGLLDQRTPARDLKERLLMGSTATHPFGEREGALRFVRNQLVMQYRKRIGS